ncbi:PRC-barrel domain OS=Afipia felis OX=1035 GN=NCTC12722_02166 PE=4 SV=1 [Afipia felis]
MKKTVLLGLTAALIAGPAFAQSTMSPSTSPASPPAATTGSAPSSAPAFARVSSDEMFSSKLKGLNVYNQNNESIGEIADIAITKNNEVQALILSVGGFLGMGERYVAVAPSSVQVSYDASTKKWKAMMNTTKEALKAAPEFKYPTTG